MCDASFGRRLVVVLKESASMPGPSLVIPISSKPIAFLRPVATKKGSLNPQDVRLLTEWRNRFVHAFLSEFQATENRTERWLTDEVGPNEGKILFMVDDLDGHTFGYMGLDFIDWGEAYGEADAVVRGGEAPRGTMKLALQTLLSWAREQLDLHELCVRVRSDNSALAFYRKVGYVEDWRVPLRRVEEPGMIRWVEDESIGDAKVDLIHMVWCEGSQE